MAFCIAFLNVLPLFSEVTRIEISSRDLFAGGMEFGSVGPLQKQMPGEKKRGILGGR